MNDDTAPTESLTSYLDQRPRLRPVEVFPVELDGRELIGLRDVSNLSTATTAVTEAALFVIQQFNGEKTVAEIAANLQTEAEPIAALVGHLDRGLFLYGERYDEARQSLLAEFDALPALPIRASKDFTAERIATALEAVRTSEPYQVWRNGGGQAARQIFGLVVPHLDFERGVQNYALGYAALEDWSAADAANRFDRVIVLGTNHFGAGTGVTMNTKAHETPDGLVPCDTALADELLAELGTLLIDQRLDHLREHSVELQLPWIREVLGAVPTLGFLVHDPTVNKGESYDGAGIGLNDFLNGLGACLRKLGGRTLLIASADLSHIGPEFGDENPNSDERLREVEVGDRAYLQQLAENRVDAFIESMRENENATRWCTLGGMAALWKLMPAGSTAQLLNYQQAVKHPEYADLTRCCVTSAALVLSGD